MATLQNMRFIDFKTPGPPDVLFINEGPTPRPKRGEVLIEVKAAGVNRADLFQRTGHYPIPKDANPVLGLEVAGIIVEKGEGTNLEIGQKVCALTNGGGYAEFCTAVESQCLPIPEPLNFIEAASLPEGYFTVWSNVFMRGRLATDEKFLIHAGASGIGTAAIQLAKAFGATVFTTVGSHEKAAFCKELNADFVINYRMEDFEQKVLELTKNQGVNLILDIVGGEYFPKNMSLLAMEGRLVNIAHLQGKNVNLDLNKMMQKRLLITGSHLRPQSTEAKAKIAKELLLNVWPLFTKGNIKPFIYKILPLEDAKEAHKLLESNQVCGKVILSI